MSTKTPATRVPGSCLTRWADCPIRAEPLRIDVIARGVKNAMHSPESRIGFTRPPFEKIVAHS